MPDAEDAAEEDLDQDRPLKIKLPVSYHLKLHKLKLLSGKNMADAIQEALDLYFETIFARKSGGASGGRRDREDTP